MKIKYLSKIERPREKMIQKGAQNLKEKNLEEAFGNEYIDYKKRVRRGL